MNTVLFTQPELRLQVGFADSLLRVGGRLIAPVLPRPARFRYRLANQLANSEPDAWRVWQLALAAPYIADLGWVHDQADAAAGERVLASVWRRWQISDAVEFRARLNDLARSQCQYDRDLFAWDSVQLMFLLRAGLAQGWLSERQFWQRSNHVAELVKTRFDCWGSLAGHFMAGVHQWGTEPKAVVPKRLRGLMLDLLFDQRSPWAAITWPVSQRQMLH